MRTYLAGVLACAVVAALAGCSGDHAKATATPESHVEGRWSPPFPMTPDESQALEKDREYLEVGGDINARLRWGRQTRLISAARLNQRSRADYLIRHGAAPHPRDALGWTALGVAVRNGHREMVELLLSHGVRANEHGVLHLAEEPALAALLIDRGADVNDGMGCGWTPLHRAANYGRKDMIELLLSRGAKVNGVSGDGYTPLGRALEQRHREAAEVLLDAGAEIDLRAACLLPRPRRAMELLDASGARPAKPKVIHWAVRGGSVDLVSFLLDHGANIEARNGARYSPLHTAAAENKTGVIELLLARGADLETRNNWNATPLFVAARAGHLQAVKLLAEAGARLTITTESRSATGSPVVRERSAMREAVKHIEVARFLAEKGLRFERNDLDAYHSGDEEKDLAMLDLVQGHGLNTLAKSNPLCLAAARGQMRVLRFLLGRAVDGDLDEKTLSAALTNAIAGGNVEAAALLMEHGARPRTYRAQELAVESNQEAMVKLVLDRADGAEGQDISDRLLLLAAGKGRVAVVRLLLDRGATDSAKAAALGAASHTGMTEAVRVLLDSGCDPGAGGPDGETPLAKAVHMGRLKAARLLIERGTPADACAAAALGDLSRLGALLDQGAGPSDNVLGWQPVHSAARNGQLPALMMLRRKGADLSTTDTMGRTALHYAIESDHLRVAKWLIENGAAVEARENNGRTPLHVAARRGWVPIADLLLKRGANINNQDVAGRTPLHYAGWESYEKWDEMGEFLLAHGADLDLKDKSGQMPSPRLPEE